MARGDFVPTSAPPAPARRGTAGDSCRGEWIAHLNRGLTDDCQAELGRHAAEVRDTATPAPRTGGGDLLRVHSAPCRVRGVAPRPRAGAQPARRGDAPYAAGEEEVAGLREDAARLDWLEERCRKAASNRGPVRIGCVIVEGHLTGVCIRFHDNTSEVSGEPKPFREAIDAAHGKEVARG